MIRVRELREARGMQQKELAIDLHVTQPTISDWESERKIPSARSTKKLADYFGVSIDYLLGRTDTPIMVGQEKPAPEEGGGAGEEELERKFMRWFQDQTPDRQKEVLFEMAMTVKGHGA